MQLNNKHSNKQPYSRQQQQAQQQAFNKKLSKEPGSNKLNKNLSKLTATGKRPST
jgi:hypothetical protein